MNDEEKFKKLISSFANGYIWSRAILDDYTEVVAKIEQTTPEAVKARILERAKIYEAEIKESAKV